MAVIIVVNLQAILAQFKDVCVLWKADRLDLVSLRTDGVSHTDFSLMVVTLFLQLVWLASLVLTLIFNLGLGLVVAVAFSLLTLLYRTQRSVNKVGQAYLCIKLHTLSGNSAHHSLARR